MDLEISFGAILLLVAICIAGLVGVRCSDADVPRSAWVES